MARSDGDELAVLSCYSVKVRCLFKFAALLWQHVTAFMQRQGWRRSQLDGVAPAAWQERSLSWTLDRYSHSYRKLWMGCVFPSLHVPPSPLQAPRGASTCLSLSSAPSHIDTPPELPLPPNLRKFIAERTSETSLGSHLHMKKQSPQGKLHAQL